MESANVQSPYPLLQIATGFWASRALYAAARFGIADLLADGPVSVEELARASGAHPGSLKRVLRALASLGVFAEDEGGLIHQSPQSLPLRSSQVGSLRQFVLMLGEPESWRAWGDVMHSVTTGTSAFEHVFGATLFDYMAAHPEAAQTFEAAMVERGAAEDEAIVAAWDFGETGRIVDVGGGRGTLLAAVLHSRPGRCGALFDLAHVVKRARSMFEAQGLASRWQGIAGNVFTDPLPAAAETYVLKKVIHDWEDTQAIEILKACGRVMTLRSRLLVMEPVIAAGNEPSFAKLLDLFMLVWPGGRERTLEEHAGIIASAGLELRRTVATQSALSILEVVRRA